MITGRLQVAAHGQPRRGTPYSTAHTPTIPSTSRSRTWQRAANMEFVRCPLHSRQDNQEETVREILVHASELLTKERRTYSGIMVSPTTDRIPLGKYCRLQDAKTGLDVQGDIVAVDLSMTATDDTNIGANEIMLTLQEALP